MASYIDVSDIMAKLGRSYGIINRCVIYMMANPGRSYGIIHR